jgi:hypothetical chaperone protein
MGAPFLFNGGIPMNVCGLDFGTSNSAIGVVRDGRPALVPVERDATLIPSALFFDYETRGRILFGAEAIAAYMGNTEGRLMRALKSILGSPLINETTALGGRKVALVDVVEVFIRHLKAKAEDHVGAEIDAVAHGRPVRFVDGDEEADAKAQGVLEAIATRVGFRHVEFVYEPVAAAYHYEQSATREEIVLIADIGGGTSDFTVVRIGPERRILSDRTSDILANAGVRVGGTDFDMLLSLDAVMPALGLGTQLINKDLPMPRALYFELATWATINFTYTHRNEREVRALVADSREPEKTRRLLRTLQNRLGHRIAFSVEDAKIVLSDRKDVGVDLGFIEGGLMTDVARAGVESTSEEKTGRLFRTAATCIGNAGLDPTDIQTIFYTGGSSRVPAVRAAISRAAPEARRATGSDLLSVALGLTREAERRFK